MHHISVVIRCFNEEKHLSQLLSSLFNQTLADIEVIIVDSGSTDSSLEIAELFETRILHISSQDFSFGGSLNIGCATAKGEIIVAISAHCYPLHKNWLECLIKPLEDNNVAVAYGMQRGNHLNQFSEHRIFHQLYGEHSDFSQSTPFINNANAAFRKTLWQSTHFNETLTGLEDLDWAYQIMKKGFRIAYVAEAPVIHIHEETWGQIFNRYKREAIAMRRIFPHEGFSLIDFMRLFSSNVLHDIDDARKQKILGKQISNILLFRWHQYTGTYQGYLCRDKINEKLRQTFYYPHKSLLNNTEHKDDLSMPSHQQQAETNHLSSNFDIIDISVAIDQPLPVWPGDKKPVISRTLSLEKNDEATVSSLTFNLHTGTHIDAPSHFIKNGKTVGDISLNHYIGDVIVRRFTESNITAAVLDAANIPKNCKRLLLHTNNSILWGKDDDFYPDFSALTPDGAKWIVKRGIFLVGIDYLSIERYNEPEHKTHHILLKSNVIIIESLNLNNVISGEYELVCLPLRMENSEASPARVILRKKK